jgi:uncharacterized membrane protein YozB (DUF420 family)
LLAACGLASACQAASGDPELEGVLLTGPLVILTLKIAVAAVTVLFVASLLALWCGRYRLHGRINLVFFTLTVATLIGFEGLIRVIQPELFDYFNSSPELRRALDIHLCFSIPSALLMPVMLFTGLTHRRKLHIGLAILFGILWLGTFVTGIFFLPHQPL